MALKRNKTIQLIIASLVLLFVLVILPLGSWYYLNNGLNYRITTMSELRNYGKLPVVSYQTFWNTSLEEKDLAGKVIVTNVLKLEDKQISSAYGAVLEKLHDQFDERNDVFFLIHVLDTATTNVQAFAAQYQLEDYEQCHFIPTTTQNLAALQANYHTTADSLQTCFTLIDTKSIIRKHYDVRDEAQVKRLVEHMALLIPLQKKEEITLKREREK